MSGLVGLTVGMTGLAIVISLTKIGIQLKRIADNFDIRGDKK
jgi:hypothetical protein